jgi:anti-sigma-K factor RskA
MRELSHEEYRSLLAPYALGAVGREEEAAVRAHLQTCDECRAEAESYAGVVPHLALVADEEPLPAGFADRLMSEVSGTRAPEGHRARAPRESKATRRGSVRRLLPGLAFGAAAIVIVILGALVVDLRSDLDLQREVAEGLLSEDARTLAGSDAQAAIVPTDEGSVFVARGMQGAPSGRTYQLWFIDEGAPTSGGTFEVEDGFATLATDQTLGEVDAVAVTLEPAGGSDQPTTEPLMTSS